MLRLVAILGIVALIGVLNMAPGHEGGSPPPDSPPPDGGGSPPPDSPPPDSPPPDGSGYTGPVPEGQTFTYTGQEGQVFTYTGQEGQVFTATGQGGQVFTYTGQDGQVVQVEQLFGGHAPPGGFQAGAFSATGGQFPGGGESAGGFPSFAGFSFSGGTGGAGGAGGPAPQISELGKYGNFGVIGQLAEGGAVGNYGLLDPSGHVLDVSGFGKGFGDFFNRSDSALAALGKTEGLKPEDIAALGGGFAVGALKDTDFLGFHAMNPSVLAAMFQQAAGPAGQVGPIGPGGLDLKPEQWAGAFGAMKPEDIKGLGNVVAEAVGNLGAQDFLAIPPDQVLAMLQGSVLNSDPQAGGGLEQNLAQYSGQLHGMLAAMTTEQYKGIDGGQMVAMMQAMNLGGQGFDLSKTALQGKDIASMFGALDQQRLGEFGGEKVLGSIQGLQKGDFGDLDAKGALNIFNAIGADKAVELQNLGGFVGKFDAEAFKQVGNQPTFDIVKALEARDFKALDKAAAFGACTILDHSQLTEVQVNNLIGLFSSVGAGASNLPTEHIGSYVKSFDAGDVASLGQEAAGNLVGAAGDDQLLGLPPDVQSAYLSTLGANLLGAGFGVAGAADTVFNIVPAGAYSFAGLGLAGGAGLKLADAVGASGAPALFGGKLFGGNSP